MGVSEFALDYEGFAVGDSLAIHADCFDWLARIPEHSLHAIVTDPPYGVKEFDLDQLHRLRNGNKGGIWRIPPSYDGHERSPLPRFTALNAKERRLLREFFASWSRLTRRAVRPGAHVFVAGNAFLSQLVWSAIVEGGLEFRGELIRIVRTLRGGDRPKNAHEEFPDVCSMARGSYEPWGIFRSPLPAGMKVSECLRLHETGGLRRLPDGRPFVDVILSERTPKREKAIADHPSLKPQSLLRQIVYTVLPLGRGVIADPFMGSGSTVAAAEAMGISCVGVERYADYYAVARRAIPRLVGARVI
jgi:site-specific DNA-methyltransferase (adenine-specific)